MNADDTQCLVSRAARVWQVLVLSLTRPDIHFIQLQPLFCSQAYTNVFIKGLFSEASKSPCVLFVFMIDSTEREAQIVKRFLTWMQYSPNFPGRQTLYVFVLGATAVVDPEPDGRGPELFDLATTFVLGATAVSPGSRPSDSGSTTVRGLDCLVLEHSYLNC
ncbi:hypothetical protein Hdeb2414_s0024g00650671 [Helianthus debilis subsp. tardiflorus]